MIPSLACLRPRASKRRNCIEQRRPHRGTVPKFTEQQQAGVRNEHKLSRRFASSQGGGARCSRESLLAGRYAWCSVFLTSVLPLAAAPLPRFCHLARLKNEASMFSQTVRSFNMQHRLLLTGTPLQVTDYMTDYTTVHGCFWNLSTACGVYRLVVFPSWPVLPCCHCCCIAWVSSHGVVSPHSFGFGGTCVFLALSR